MANVGMSDIKKGVRLIVGEVPYKIVEFQHVKPGKGAAFVRMKMKSFLNGKVVEKTVHAGDKFEVPIIEYKTMQYLYDDGEMYQFMDNETYDQLGLSYEQCDDAFECLACRAQDAYAHECRYVRSGGFGTVSLEESSIHRIVSPEINTNGTTNSARLTTNGTISSEYRS